MDSNTDNNKSHGSSSANSNTPVHIEAGSPADLVLAADSQSPDKNLSRNSSSPSKSPSKRTESTKNNDEQFDLASRPAPDREAQERAIQSLLKKYNEENPGKSPSKQNGTGNTGKPRLNSDLDGDSDDSPFKPRERIDRVVFSPKDTSVSAGSEQDFSAAKANFPHKLEKSQSIVESDLPKEFEGFQRTYTQVMEKPTADHSQSLLLPARNSDITKAVNVGKELKFMDKNNWTDELKCYVCSRSFSKMDGIFTHHCRACGKSVCGDCSTRKINDNRACDVCFYKASNVLVEERRKNLLTEKTLMLKAYKKKAEDARKYLEELNEKKKALEKKIYEEREDQDKAFLMLQKEKVKIQENLDKKKSSNNKLKEALETEQAFLKKKEEATNEMKEVLNSIRLDLAEKRGNINSKQEESERLTAQKQYYEKSYNSCLEKDGVDSDLPRTSSLSESCDPNLPGAEETNKNIEEPEEISADPNKIDE